MSCQDFKDNSQEISIPLVLTKAQITIGYMKEIKKKPGCSPKECGDGSSGKMELTFFLLINLKQDGITFQTVDLMLNKIPGKVSTTQSMFITTISTLMSMSNQEKLEVLKEQIPVNSYPKASSMMKADGEECQYQPALCERVKPNYNISFLLEMINI